MTQHPDMLPSNKPLHRMFTAVPPRYDLINRVMTWGLDKKWRREAARECLVARPHKILDLCCGTGDLAINTARLSGDNVEVVGVDYSQPMLEIAARKAELRAGGKNVSFVYGDAANLPFRDGCFDCVGISFAFRNLTYKNPNTQRHLAEIFRVLNKGGRFVIVETSQPKSKMIRRLYHLYLRWFVFVLGYLISSNKGAYRYLAESASRFYDAGEVKDMLLTAGFRKMSFHPLLLGAVGIYIATK